MALSLNRHRLRFSLRSLLISILVIGLGSKYIVSKREWVRERENLLTDRRVWNTWAPSSYGPGGLWLFRLAGYDDGTWWYERVWVLSDPEADTWTDRDQERELERVRRLFPEARRRAGAETRLVKSCHPVRTQGRTGNSLPVLRSNKRSLDKIS